MKHTNLNKKKQRMVKKPQPNLTTVNAPNPRIDEPHKDFFKKLINKCHDENAYSVIETAKKMGVNYEQVQEWAATNKMFTEVLVSCRRICFDNAEIDGLNFKLPEKETFRYMCENDEEFKKEFEEKKTIEEREKLIKEGKEIPAEQRKDTVAMKGNALEQLKANDALTATKAPTSVDEKRIEEWKAKSNESQSNFNFEVIDKGSRVFDLIGNSTGQRNLGLQEAAICAATGSAGKYYSSKLFTDTVSCFVTKGEATTGKDITFITNAVLEALASFKPKDETEGMLSSHLVALHEQAMNFMSRVSIVDQTPAGIDMNINRATKLMRLYNESLEALNRYRRKGEQKVTVQHQYVNVNSGGQAIVGSKINGQGGGVNGKR